MEDDNLNKNNRTDDKNNNKSSTTTEKGPYSFLLGSLTSLFLFALFYWMSSNVAIYFATHKPTNTSDIVQSISSSVSTLIIGLFFLGTFSFAFIGFGLFIVFIRSFLVSEN